MFASCIKTGLSQSEIAATHNMLDGTEFLLKKCYFYIYFLFVYLKEEIKSEDWRKEKMSWQLHRESNMMIIMRCTHMFMMQ